MGRVRAYELCNLVNKPAESGIDLPTTKRCHFSWAIGKGIFRASSAETLRTSHGRSKCSKGASTVGLRNLTIASPSRFSRGESDRTYWFQIEGAGAEVLPVSLSFVILEELSRICTGGDAVSKDDNKVLPVAEV